ncbi:MAG: ferredoxin reductase, partial [Paraburkholderia fungorum]|nr:ferredoxin reductase [Paraburkholderia fungorum]
DEIPYYWSDQYDQRIQVLGIPQGDEELVRGNAGNNAFIVFHLLRDRLVGATCINQPKAVAPLRRLIASGKTPDRKKMIDIDLDIRKLADDDQQ